MHPLLRAPYTLAAQLARAASILTPPLEGKIAASLRARRGLRARVVAWGRTHRDPTRPLLWLHAPSVGEGLQARAVLEVLRARHPAWQVAYTFFSPSAANFARGLGADFTDYLPFDTAGEMRALCDALRPNALVFSKVDLWPVLAATAQERAIPLGMISATLSGVSSREGTVARWLLHDAYAALDAVGTVDDADAERLIALGARPDVVRVTGDTRYDQVWQRAQRVERYGALLAPLASTRPTLVAGSTWPADESPLLAAWSALRARHPALRLIIAPHEPTATHLEPIERAALANGFTVARLGTPEQQRADVILVDRVGVLGDLYAVADVAFVGGGFHRAGLHSVLEPAAFGVPVVFGPQHRNARDAALLLRDGGGFQASSGESLRTQLSRLFGDEQARLEAGRRALGLVTSGLGAAERSAAMVETLMARR